MTDRDKRISELSSLLAVAFVEKMKPDGIKYEDIAESIVDGGYQKISEGYILIHKDPTKRTEEEIEWLVNHNKEVREEVFDKLIKVSGNFNESLPVGVLKAWAIEFGVEIKK